MQVIVLLVPKHEQPEISHTHKKCPHSHSIAGGSCSARRQRAENKALQRQRERGTTPLQSHTPSPPVESWSHPIRSSSTSMASLDARHRRRLCTPASVLIIACLVSLLAGLLFGEHAWVCCSVRAGPLELKLVVCSVQQAPVQLWQQIPHPTAVHSLASRSEAAAKKERACASPSARLR